MFYVGVKCGCCKKVFREAEVGLCVSVEMAAEKIRDEAYDDGWDLLLGIGLCCPGCLRIAHAKSLVPDADDVTEELEESCA